MTILRVISCPPALELYCRLAQLLMLVELFLERVFVDTIPIDEAYTVNHSGFQ